MNATVFKTDLSSFQFFYPDSDLVSLDSDFNWVVFSLFLLYLR